MTLKHDLSWNQWFAGLVDGDGCFYINRKQEISFELTTHIVDLRLLSGIKNKFKGGSIQLRSGSKSARYRVKQKSTVKTIVHCLNGLLQNPTRLNKFQQACFLLDIVPILPIINRHTNLRDNHCFCKQGKRNKGQNLIIESENAYLSGLIDSDGTISISVSKTNSKDSQKTGLLGKQMRLQNSRGFNQLYLKITCQFTEPLLFIQSSYNLGKIYTEKANKNNRCHVKYNWTVKSYDDFVGLYAYLKKYPLKSVKMHRMRLALHYFQHKKRGYHLKEVDSLEYKIWVKFCKSWFKYSC